MRQPNADSSAYGDTDCNGNLYANGNGHGDIYPYSYSDGYCNSNGHTYWFAKLHAGLHIHLRNRNDRAGSH